MGATAIPLNQASLDRFSRLFSSDGFVVEDVGISEFDRARGGVGRFRLTSDQGAKLLLDVVRDVRFPPFQLVCTVHVESGNSLNRVSHDVYHIVVEKLQKHATAT